MSSTIAIEPVLPPVETLIQTVAGPNPQGLLNLWHNSLRSEKNPNGTCIELLCLESNCVRSGVCRPET